ncbi:uncharacterized protein B0J16DRAFT_356122 [Fusarium flagelliforme]|uniref:uncharacterized protein n=1 Tax=Fusarium flagelliforme TaxID=2675880 RepID=UPI001E8CF738|nr:uncharacterized protein B0J16DRAFT_356122 [Fusarium flagelliforme]KAH7186030.1 hypothetical protein B0J16DRAFT_356122 [Fusarium flagelliforme]
MSDAEDRDLSRADEDEDDEDEDDDHDTALNDAINDMQATFNTPDPPQQEIDDFIKRHGDVVTQPWDNHGSFLHEIILRVSKKTKFTWGDPDHISPLVATLVAQYPQLLEAKNDESQTPLYQAIRAKKFTYKLVDCILRNSQEEHIQKALEFTFGVGPSLKTCLTIAFETLGEPGTPGKASTLSNLIVKASDKALGTCDGSGKSPFHYAVRYNQCSAARVLLIERLLDKDSRAVAKLRDVSHDAPLATFLDLQYTRKDDGMTYSVYTEHERTKSVFEAEEEERKEQESKTQDTLDRPPAKAPTISLPAKDKDPPKAPSREKGPKSTDDRDRGGKKPDTRKQAEPEVMNEHERLRQQLKEEERRQLERLQIGEENGYPQDLTLQLKGLSLGNHGDTNGETLSKIRTSQLKTSHAPNSPIKRVSTGSKGAETVKKSKKKTSAAKTLSADVLEKNSEKVHVHISFDCYGLLSETHDEVFSKQFGENAKRGITFDKVLMYARFPVVKVIRTGRRAPKRRAKGRQDMEFFAEWLRGKGVERILTLQVREDDQDPHSDESIQIALRKFTVEHIDWQKPDLDPSVICETADIGKGEDKLTNELIKPRKDLRQLTLKWSGSNAALRAWSEPSGLPQMLDLRKIILDIPANSDLIDHRDWVKRNLKLFQIRLNQSLIANQPPKKDEDEEDHPTIEVVENWNDRRYETPTARKNVPKSAGIPDAADEHEWISQMERFSGPMRTLWEETLKESIDPFDSSSDEARRISSADSQILSTLRKDVVVALIDDGVDTLDPAFSNRFVEGKTFDYRGDDGVGQYYVSANGHGTDMARMILKVCPMASIYSIKLKTQPSIGGRHLTIDESSVAPAIEAALEKNADIISMSWTIPIPEEGTENRKRIDEVLKRACKQKVLMFCSSPDQKSQTKHYPSHYDRDKIFLIGAADDSGTLFNHAGQDNNFIFPGVNVNTSNRYSNDSTSIVQKSTGSSIATALSAGLAAMVTYCFKASALASVTTRIAQGRPPTASGTELVKPQDVDRIAHHDGLKRVFERIGTMDGGKFIAVWGVFRPATECLTDGKLSYEQKITHIMELCRDLMDRMDR